MKSQLFEEVAEHFRQNHLRDNAYCIETQKYRKYFTEKELADKNKEFVTIAVDYNREEEVAKEMIEKIKTELREKKKAMVKMLNLVDKGFDEVEGPVYMMDDQLEGYMGYYDETGRLISQRLLKPEEKQLRITPDNASNF